MNPRCLVPILALLLFVHGAAATACPKASRATAHEAIAEWTDRFGEEGYRRDRDEELGLIYLTALDDRSHRLMREMLETQAAYLIDTLFDAPPAYEVAIIIPKPEHARVFFDAGNIGGMYSHGRHRLIARNIGFTLRHEFVHVLHFRHMEAKQQPHRLWVQEGIAALFEDYELDDRGDIQFIANERHNVIRNRVRAGGAMPWRTLFELPGERFMSRATALYPQARSIFEFLADEGKLAAWYRAYVEHFDDDPDGSTAFEQVFNQPVREIERRWRRWVQRQPEVQNRTRRGDPSIGIQTDPLASNDGVVVTSMLRDSPARRAGLRPRDVIVAVDDRITPTLEELRQAVMERGIGGTARIKVRRGSEYLTFDITIESRQGAR